MAETKKIINNPSITTDVFEYDEVGRVSAIAGHPLAGEGGGTIEKSDLMWKPTVGSDGYVRWSLASSATTPDAAYISGAQGPAGPQGVSGNPGKNPEFQINSENAHWEWKYSGDEGWTDLGVVASGAVGPQGLSGNSGKDGISPTVTTATITGGNRVIFTYGEGSSTYIDVMSGASGANGKDGISPTVSTETIEGGNRVTFTYGEGSTESIDVMSGASGAKGSDGFSPTVTITDAPTATHSQGGKTVTITDIDHPTGQSFDIWNGVDGAGATVNLFEGNGIQITHEASTTNYTISVSADYATKSYVDSASAYALNEAKDWVEGKHYLTQVIHDTTLTGQGNANDSKLGVAWSALSGNTIASASSAYWAVKAKTNDGQHIYTIGTELYSLNTLTQYLDSWAETITGDQGIEVLDTNEEGYPDKFQLTQTAYSAITSVSSKLDTTAAAQTYQTIADMSNYLTTTVASQTYLDKTTYATDSATFVTSSSNTITGTDQFALTTTGWAKVQAGTSFTGVTSNDTLTGIGTDASHKLGVAWSALSGNTITSANKAGEAQGFRWGDNSYQDTSAALTNLWNSKNHVTLQTADNILTVDNNDNTSATLSAMSYIANSQHAGWEPQKSCVCQESEIYAMSQLANGQGMLFFIVSAH